MNPEINNPQPETPEEVFRRKFNDPTPVQINALKDLYELNEARQNSGEMLETDADEYVEDTTLGILIELLVTRIKPLLIHERILRRTDMIKGYEQAYAEFQADYDSLVAQYTSQGEEFSTALNHANSFLFDILNP